MHSPSWVRHSVLPSHFDLRHKQVEGIFIIPAIFWAIPLKKKSAGLQTYKVCIESQVESCQFHSRISLSLWQTLQLGRKMWVYISCDHETWFGLDKSGSNILIVSVADCFENEDINIPVVKETTTGIWETNLVVKGRKWLNTMSKSPSIQQSLLFIFAHYDPFTDPASDI